MLGAITKAMPLMAMIPSRPYLPSHLSEPRQIAKKARRKNGRDVDDDDEDVADVADYEAVPRAKSQAWIKAVRTLWNRIQCCINSQ